MLKQELHTPPLAFSSNGTSPQQCPSFILHAAIRTLGENNNLLTEHVGRHCETMHDPFGQSQKTSPASRFDRGAGGRSLLSTPDEAAEEAVVRVPEKNK